MKRGMQAPPPMIGIRVVGKLLVESVLRVARATGRHPQVIVTEAVTAGLPLVEQRLARAKETNR